MGKDAKKYYNNIYKLFPIHTKREKDYLKELKILINEFAEEDNKVTYNDFVNQFGSPIDVVTSYYQNFETKDLLKAANRKCILKAIFGIILVIGLTLLCWKYYFYYQAYQDYQKTLPAFQDNQIEIIQ